MIEKKIKLNWWQINLNQRNIKKDFNNSLDKKLISQGSVTKKIEQKICSKLKIKHCVLNTSGTASLYLSLLYIKNRVNNSKKNEVIISDRSWISPAHAAYLLGLKLVFVDVKKDIPICDEKEITKKINNKTLCVICVQLNGRAVDVDYIKRKNKKIFIIEDAAQSFYSKKNENFIGTRGDIGIFSFSMGKIITSGQGGAIITNSKKIFNSIKLLKNNGIIDRYVDKWNMPGFNFKFTDIQASILISQINNLKQNKSKLINLFNYYKKKIKNIPNIELVDKKLEKGRIPLYIECISKNKKIIFKKIIDSKKFIRTNYQCLYKTKYFKDFVKKKEIFKK